MRTGSVLFMYVTISHVWCVGNYANNVVSKHVIIEQDDIMAHIGVMGWLRSVGSIKY